MTATIASLTGVTKRYGSVTALNGIDFKLGRGEVTALLGANGAGKTSAVRLLLGLARPTSGKVEVLGGDPSLPSTRRHLGTMLQVGKVPETLRVREHINLFSSYYDQPLPLQEVLTLSGLDGLQDRPFGKLSGGQKQRVLFALAICGDPQLLLLDEPTVGLDIEARRLMWEQIRKLVARGRSVLLTTHYLEEADALADRVTVIHQGAIVAEGTAREVKNAAAAKTIRFRSDKPLEAIREIPGIQSAARSLERIEIRARDTDAVTRALLAFDPLLIDLEIAPAGLEEAFLALTSKEIA